MAEPVSADEVPVELRLHSVGDGPTFDVRACMARLSLGKLRIAHLPHGQSSSGAEQGVCALERAVHRQARAKVMLVYELRPGARQRLAAAQHR